MRKIKGKMLLLLTAFMLTVAGCGKQEESLEMQVNTVVSEVETESESVQETEQNTEEAETETAEETEELPTKEEQETIPVCGSRN